MPSQITNYQCPSCTGPLRYDGASGKLQCDYCGSSFTIAQIDKIYHCVDLSCGETGRRKPEIGMAKEAKQDFPEVDFAESTMVGDSISDLQFGYKAGMQTVYLLTDGDAPVETKDYTDKFYSDLKTFAETL